MTTVSARLKVSSRLKRLYELDDHRDRILPMEGLRGLAVLLVFCVHIRLFNVWVRPDAGIEVPINVGWQLGQSGVDLFFVLSGYLIYGAVIRRPIRYDRFLTRRVQRIYPVFLVMFAAYVVLDLVLPDSHRIPSGVLPAIGYLAENLALLPGILPITPLLTVAWSLSFEFCYYLLIPVAVLALRMRAWRPWARIAFFAGVSVLMFVLGWAGHADLIRMAMFLAGVIVFEILNGFGWRPTPRWELLAVVVAVLALGCLTLFEVDPRGGPGLLGLPGAVAATDRLLVLFVAFGLLCLVGFHAQGPLRRVLVWTPLRWLGNMSYSFYLVHSLVLKALAMVLGRVLPAQPQSPVVYVGLFVVAFATAWVASSALYGLVERPFSLGRAARRARRSTAAAVALLPAAVVPAVLPAVAPVAADEVAPG
ncbi:peptidoglycan/LPS O-acetylase OafA/YrhL [Friedmanniella endophytica]|uniref:Peptidoglycan/LPS O-acetylase OafA/YrhL n=1 Tax=Microlunatus kandeliicorticis TaxID=1759536 RepID=A0A7W3P6Q4_9ACTN|nr:acyltransferase [Microlunatus kandeliicorticis]MBA8795192.1 peptidoglycan/LPS O-acetylase OafA/YrhL [Microlunatus kandeliicorticis]